MGQEKRDSFLFWGVLPLPNKAPPRIEWRLMIEVPPPKFCFEKGGLPSVP